MSDDVRKPRIRTRLSVLFAAAAPKAVILRRGPRTHWNLVAWDLKTDTFTSGQWMKGLVKLCDLSPSGSRLMYWAAQYHMPTRHRTAPVRSGPYDPIRALAPRPTRAGRKTPRYMKPEPGPQGGPRRPMPIGGPFTAISTPPYFSALAIWPGFGHWTGGGAFLDERNILLNETPEALTPIANVPIPKWFEIRSLLPHRATARLCATWPSEGVNLDDGPIAPGLLASGAEWVDWIHISGKDLLFACDGCVYRLSDWQTLPPQDYLKCATLLADLRPLHFELVKPPAEALRW